MWWVPSLLQGQNITFNLLDGSLTSFPLGELRTLTFDGDIVTLTLHDGGTSSWDTNLINRNEFDGVAPQEVRVAPRLFLDGPFVPDEGLMHDSLRCAGLVPLREPFTALGFTQVGCGGGEVTIPAVLERMGSNAIVDWVFLELVQANAVVHTRSALLQRDGDVVDIDGASPLLFYAPDGEYHLRVLHRNHLGVGLSSALSLSRVATLLDLTAGSQVYGVDPLKVVGALRTLWSGDITADGMIKYTGSDNDRDPILIKIGGAIPTSVAHGYAVEDLNMDGLVKYTGPSNDRDLILQAIGGAVPTNVRHAQWP